MLTDLVALKVLRHCLQLKRCSWRECRPMLPWPVWPLAGQSGLGQNTVARSMSILLALSSGLPRVWLDLRFCYKSASPRFSAELPTVKRVFVTLIFSLHLASLAGAEVRTDLQKEGFIGLVRTVQIQTAQFSNQAGQWVEGPRGRPAIITYDVKGNRIEGKSEDTTKTAYTYDAQGRVIEEVTSDHVGLIGKTVYTYDDKGNLTEEEVYGPSGLKYRSEHIYDDQGRRIATTNDDTHDPALGIEKVVMTYDNKGNIREMTTYYTHKIGDEEDRPIPPPAKRVYTYEFDTHGNWIKQTQTLCTAETGEPVCEPFMVTYRTITYYPETERPQP
jgi:YD repeat-containing protein